MYVVVRADEIAQVRVSQAVVRVGSSSIVVDVAGGDAIPSRFVVVAKCASHARARVCVPSAGLVAVNVMMSRSGTIPTTSPLQRHVSGTRIGNYSKFVRVARRA